MALNKDIVFNAFVRKRNLTDVELAEYTGIHGNSVRPVRLSLQRLGAIRKTETKRQGHRVYEVNRDYDFTKTQKKPSYSALLTALRKQRKMHREAIEKINKLMDRIA
jgi:transcription initiation factor IIE alpha subunit